MVDITFKKNCWYITKYKFHDCIFLTRLFKVTDIFEVFANTPKQYSVIYILHNKVSKYFSPLKSSFNLNGVMHNLEEAHEIQDQEIIALLEEFVSKYNSLFNIFTMRYPYNQLQRITDEISCKTCHYIDQIFKKIKDRYLI